MKSYRVSMVIAAVALTASTAAMGEVKVAVGVGLVPFGFGVQVAPPLIYQPVPYAAPPPVVYVGGGSWGGDRGRGHRDPHDRGHDQDRGRGGDRHR